MPRKTLGLIEKVKVFGDSVSEVIARIDTGAERSSIDSSLLKSLKLPISDHTKKIRSAAGVNRRPLSEIEVSIVGKKLKGVFTVADRSRMKYPLLIGQNILKEGAFIIDPLKETKL